MAVACATRQTPAPVEYLLRKAGLGQEESMPSSGRLNFMSQRTSEVSDGDEPTVTVQFKVTRTAHPRSLHRLVRPSKVHRLKNLRHNPLIRSERPGWRYAYK